MSKKKYYIVKLESYSGEYSSLQCETDGNDVMASASYLMTGRK
ncbi:MAG: hypothetical protein WC721_20065 [Victivallaceae bacterium]|jgi:hypothetical protein